ATVPSAYRWVTYFTAPDGTLYYVSMSTNDGAAPTFEYGIHGFDPAAGASTFQPLGALADGSGYTPDGRITLVLDKSAAGPAGRRGARRDHARRAPAAPGRPRRPRRCRSGTHRGRRRRAESVRADRQYLRSTVRRHVPVMRRSPRRAFIFFPSAPPAFRRRDR